MSFNTNGTYYPPAPEFPAVPGEIIYAEYFNTIIEDIADALSLAYVRDGRAAMTGDIPMGGKNIKNLGLGTLNLPSIRFVNDSDTGLNSTGPGQLSLVVDGVPVIDMTADSITFNQDLTVFGQSVLVPPYLIQNAGVL